MKMTTFIIGLLLVSMFAGIFGVIMFTSREALNPDLFQNKSLNSFDKFNQLNQTISEVKTKSEDLSSAGSVFDLVGSFFSDAYAALKLAFKSVDVFRAVAQDTVDAIPITDGNNGIIQLLYNYIILIMIVLVVIGIMISAVVKWSL